MDIRGVFPNESSPPLGCRLERPPTLRRVLLAIVLAAAGYYGLRAMLGQSGALVVFVLLCSIWIPLGIAGVVLNLRQPAWLEVTLEGLRVPLADQEALVRWEDATFEKRTLWYVVPAIRIEYEQSEIWLFREHRAYAVLDRVLGCLPASSPADAIGKDEDTDDGAQAPRQVLDEPENGA